MNIYAACGSYWAVWPSLGWFLHGAMSPWQPSNDIKVGTALKNYNAQNLYQSVEVIYPVNKIKKTSSVDFSVDIYF